MKHYLCFPLALLISISGIHAQYSQRKLSKKQQEYTDSLKNVTYNHSFPILGQKAYKMGFDIPYPVGVMGNYFYVNQGIIIENLQLGLQSQNHDIPLTPIDFVEFGSNDVTANTFMVRPDLWVFPFLDVYGIFGFGTSTTTVNLTIPVELTSVVEQG